jgi:hypothetical protein
MQKIDRLGWAAERAFLSYGLVIGIRSTDPAVLDAIETRLPPGRRRVPASRVERLYSLVVGGEASARGVRRYHVLYADPVRIARSLVLPDVLKILETDLELYVAERARRRVFVHAGVVGWRGRAIVIPGPSMSGKSRLVAAWLDAGATYYSDEYAVLDDRGRVHPYPRPLQLRDAPPASSPPVAGTAPLPVGLVMVTRYREGGRFRPRTISRGQAGIASLANTVAARHRPAVTLTALARAFAGARALAGVRGEAAEAVRAVASEAAAWA